MEEGVYKRRCILCMMLSIASDQKHRKMTVNYVLKIAIKLLALIFSQPPPPDLGRAEVEEGVYKRRCILCMMLSIASDQKHRKMTVNYVLKIAIKLLALIFSQPPPPDLGRAEVEEGVYKRRCILCMMLSIASDQKHRKMTVNYVLKIAIKLLALIFSQPPPPDLGRAEVEEGVYKRRCILCMMLSIASDQKHRKMTVNYVLKIAIKLLALIFSQPPPPDLGRAEVEEGVYKRRCILCMMLSIASDQKHRKMTVNYVLKIAIKLLALIFSQPPPPDLGRAEVEEGVYKRRCILCMMLSIASDQKHRKMTVNYVLKIAIKLLALIFSQPPPPDLGRAEVEEGVYKRRCILCMMLSIASDQKHRKMTVNYVLKIAIKLLALIFSQPPPPDLGRAEVEEGVYKRRCILCMMLSIASDQKHRKMTVNYVLKIAIKLLALIFSQPPPPDLGRAEVEEGVYKRRCILCMMLSIASDQKHRKMTVNYVLKIAIKLLALIFSQPPPPDLGRAEVEEGVYKRRCILCMMLSIASDQKHRKMTVNYVLKIAIKLLALIFSQPPPPDLGRAEVEEGVYKRRCILCMMLSIASDQKHRKMTVNYVLKIAIKLLALIFSQPPPPDLGRAEVEEGVYKRRCILCMMLSIASDQKHRKMTVNYVLKIAIKLLALIFSQPPPPDLGRAEVEEGVYKRRCILCMMLSIASDQKHRKMTVNYVLKIAIKLLALIFSQPPPPDLGRAEVEEGVYKRRCILCMMLSIASDQKHRKMTVNYVLKIAIKLLALIFSQPPPPDLGRAEVEEGVYKRRCILCMMLSIASDQKHRKMTVNYVLKIAIKLLALIFSQPPPPDLGRAEVEEGVYKRRCILCMMLSIASDQKHRKMTVNYVLKIAVDAESLQELNSEGFNLVLTKGNVVNSAAGIPYPLIWIAVKAFENNEVLWSGAQYELYASSTQVQEGAVINRLSTTNQPADPSKTYTFKNGVFNEGTDQLIPAYNVTNEEGQTLLFGLAQSATINGAEASGPFEGINLPNNASATFTPSEDVQVFFNVNAQTSQCTIAAGTTPCVLHFSPQNPTQSIVWDPSSKTFIPVGPSMVTRDAQITTDVTPVSVILDHVVSKVGHKRSVPSDWNMQLIPVAKQPRVLSEPEKKTIPWTLIRRRDTDAESEDDQLAIDLQNTSAQQEEGDYMFTNVYYDHEGHKIKSFSYRYRSSVMSHTAMREGQWYKYKPVGQTWIFEDPKVDDTYGAWMYEDLKYMAEYKGDMVKFTLAHYGSVIEALADINRVERVSDDDDTDSYVSDTEMVKSAYNVCPSDELEEASSSDEVTPKAIGYVMETGVTYTYRGWTRQNGTGVYILFDGSIMFTPYGMASRCPMPVQTFASNRDFWDCKDVNPATLKDMKSIRDKESYDLFLVKHSTEIEKCSHLKSFLSSICKSLKTAKKRVKLEGLGTTSEDCQYQSKKKRVTRKCVKTKSGQKK